MDSNFVYYVICLLAVVIGFLFVKKVASCLIKSVVMFAIIAILALIYFVYFR